MQVFQATPTLCTRPVLMLVHAMKAFHRAVCHHPTHHIKALFIDLSGNNSKSHVDLIRCPQNKFRNLVSRLERVWWWSRRWWRKSLFLPTSRWKTTSWCQKSIRIPIVLFLLRNVKNKNTLHMIHEERENLSQSYHSNDIIWFRTLLSWPPPHP